MLTGTWPAPAGTQEYAVWFDEDREKRLLVVPALLDEANKLRRLTLDTMRALDGLGVDSFLPDLPGTNESIAGLIEQDIDCWRSAISAAAEHFRATHVLALRGGALCVDTSLPRAHYAPVAGSKIVRNLLRGHLIGEREAGRDMGQEEAVQQAFTDGLRMGGYDCSASMWRGIDAALPGNAHRLIEQAELDGPALWLRSEPEAAPSQSARLAALVAEWLA